MSPIIIVVLIAVVIFASRAPGMVQQHEKDYASLVRIPALWTQV